MVEKLNVMPRVDRYISLMYLNIQIKRRGLQGKFGIVKYYKVFAWEHLLCSVLTKLVKHQKQCKK